MRILTVCSVLVLLAAPAFGLEPYLVQDINPLSQPDDSNPEDVVRLGGAVLFFATDESRSLGLWRSDGTAAGTYRLSDICPADCNRNGVSFLLTERLYFFLAPGTSESPHPLWVSDGTPAGTFPLTRPEVSAVLPRALWSSSQNLLYFVAEDPEHGAELWRSDGTPAGTWLVSDVRPGPAGSDPRELTEYRGRIWFSADDGQRGGALWSADGTPAGTVLAIDPIPSSASHPAPENLVVLGKRLTFSAIAPGRGAQVWAGDGTAKGTAPITTLAGKSPSRVFITLARGNRLYFVAEDKKGQELWVTDGTARGTRVLTSLPRRDAFFQRWVSLDILSRAFLKDRLIFWADDGPHGIEPWVTDGTPKGTRLLRDVCPGTCSSAWVIWYEFRGRLYFTAGNQALGYELWSTDGTPAGTRLALDMCPGSCDGDPFAPQFVGDRLLFVANDGQTGQELWSTDGTAAGTVRVSSFEPDDVIAGRFHGEVLNGQLLFGALGDLQHGRELWRSDGTPAGTQLVRDINTADLGGSFVNSLRAFGDSAVFYADDGVHGFELWRSHGPGPGASLIADLVPGEEPTAPPGDLEGEAAGGLFYFLRPSGELWRTDGTEAGTFRLLGAEDEPCCLRAAGGRIFFVADDGVHGEEVWTSDGTAAGTHMVEDVIPFGRPENLIEFQGRLYFSTPDGLWRSDGTAAGTVLVRSVFEVTLPVVHAGRLWFLGSEEWLTSGQLWSSDGTEAGTVPAVEDIPGEVVVMASIGTALIFSGYDAGPGIWASDGTPEGTRKISSELISLPLLHPWAALPGRLFFDVNGDDHLWVSDGTEAGTGPLHDRDGQLIPTPEAFATLGNLVLFVAGESLYQSDGTPAGTFRIREGVSPELVRAGDRVFFGAFDPANGWELWAVRP